MQTHVKQREERRAAAAATSREERRAAAAAAASGELAWLVKFVQPGHAPPPAGWLLLPTLPQLLRLVICSSKTPSEHRRWYTSP